MVGAPVRQCCEADCWAVARACSSAEAYGWEMAGCFPYFACCYVDEVTSNGTVTVYFNYKGSCFYLDGTETEVATRPNGCELTNILDGDGNSYSTCSECISDNDEWYEFEKCDCENDGSCTDHKVHIPVRFLDGTIGNCDNDCFSSENCRYWKDPRNGCCMDSCLTVTNVSNCCDIWTPRHSHDIDDCTTCRADGEGNLWRGCCACCEDDASNVDECLVFRGLSTYDYTHVTTGCTQACGGSGSRIPCEPAGGSVSVTLNFSVSENELYDPIFDQTSCIILNMGEGETDLRCDGHDFQCCVGDENDCGPYGYWCKKVGDAEGAGCPTAGECCGEQYCEDYGLWIHRQHGHSYYGLTMGLQNPCHDGNGSIGVYLRIWFQIKYPAYIESGNCETGECTEVPFGNCVYCSDTPLYSAAVDSVVVLECLLLPDNDTC